VIRLILLDRDGVINEDSPDYIKSVEEFVPIPGALETIVRLRHAGLKIALCTNQSAVGRGLVSPAGLTAIHTHLQNRLAALGGGLDGIAACPHRPEDECGCRKPRPGMLESVMRTLQIPPADTLFVGDSIRDMEAAAAAGCGRVLVRTGNGRHSEAAARRLGVTSVFDDLGAFGAALLRCLQTRGSAEQ
jgi:D-glycero-D-manno-heptose 1,7-bisphosphate phosphatase